MTSSRSFFDIRMRGFRDRTDVSDVVRLLEERVPILGEERAAVSQAAGRVLALDVPSEVAVPGFDRAAMDGYAVQAADTDGASPERPLVLEVIGEIAAGYLPDLAVRPGTAIRIMTGAPVPPGADSIVPFEETDEVQQRSRGTRGADIKQIGVYKAARVGNNVRRAGGDVREGALVLTKGTLIGAAQIGVLATLGKATVKVYRRPVVTILATGDELIEPGEPVEPGKIYNANAYTIAAMVKVAGGIPKVLGIARDTIESLREKVAAGLEADLFLTSAGVSTGEYDLVKDVLTRSGEMDFWRVRIRPGKPLAFGVLRGRDADGNERDVPHIGLPGNTVSTMIAFDQFARPAIHLMLGRGQVNRPTVEATMADTVENDDFRRFFVRTILSREGSDYVARVTGPQGSNVLTSMALANSFAVIPEDWPRVKAGERIRVQILEGYEDLLT